MIECEEFVGAIFYALFNWYNLTNRFWVHDYYSIIV
jgi:hypothetical protein